MTIPKTKTSAAAVSRLLNKEANGRFRCKQVNGAVTVEVLSDRTRGFPLKSALDALSRNWYHVSLNNGVITVHYRIGG